MSTHHGTGDRWLAGERIPGVEFALHDPVEIVAGQFDGEQGTIALLMGLAPEPAYLVTVRGRGDVRLRQSTLRPRTGE